MHSPAFFAFVLLAGATIWLLGLTGKRMKRVIAPPLLALAAGALHRLIFGQVMPRDELLGLMETLCWFAVGFGVASIALRLRGRDIRRLLSTGGVLVLVAMAGMWVVTTMIVAWIFGLPPLVAAVIGAILTPTDPVIGSSIVTGPFAERHIPARIRQMLSFESGGNDGLAFLFMFLPILLLHDATNGWGGPGWGDWLLRVGLWQVVAAGVIGLGLGHGAGRALKAARAAGQIGRRSLMLASLTFMVGLLGLMKLIDTDSIWAAFLAGLALATALGDEVREAADQYEEGGNNLAMVPALMLFAMAVPWGAWGGIWGAGLLALGLVLAFRRLPVMWLLYLLLKPGAGRPVPSAADQARDGVDPRPFRAPRDAWFYGWFGPIGLSAMFYAGAAHRELADPRLWPITSFLIAGSILAHGLTAAPFTRLYARATRDDRS